MSFSAALSPLEINNQPAGQPILTSATLAVSHSLPQSTKKNYNNNHVYSIADLRFFIAGAHELATPAAATVRCLPRATLAFDLACAGKQAAMPSTHGGMATRWCPVRSIRSRSTSRPSLSSHSNIAHGNARSCAESDRSASARVIPSLCAHPTAGSLPTALVTKKPAWGNDEQRPLGTGLLKMLYLDSREPCAGSQRHYYWFSK